MAFPDNDFVTLSSGATHFRPWRSSTDDGYDVVVVGSGNSSTDNTNIATAVSALNSAGRGTLWIDGEVYVTSQHTITKPIKLRGRSSSAMLKCTDTAGYAFVWDGTGLPAAPSASHYDISATAGNEYFTTTAFTPSRGQYVLLYSEDQVTDAPPHLGSTAGQFPCEMHRIEYWDSGNNRAYIDGPMFDTLSTNAKAVVLPYILEDVVVADITAKFDGTTQPTGAAIFYLRGVNGATIENVHCLQDGAGSIYTQYAMGMRMAGIRLDGTDAADYVYGILIGTCNGVTISDFTITGTRHAFTTGANWTDSGDRYGTAAKIRLSNGVVAIPSKVSGSTRSGLDTHAEGYDITFDGITVSVGDEYDNHCLKTRSRYTTVMNCTFRGKETGSAMEGRGVVTFAGHTVVKNCVFDRLERGVDVAYSYATSETYQNNCVVQNNVFRNIAGPAMRTIAGNNHVFQNNYCYQVGRTSGSTYSASAVDFREGSGHQIIGNYMPKGSNTYSVYIGGSLDQDDVVIYQNIITGYTGMAIGGTYSNEATAKYAPYNCLGYENRVLTLAAGDTTPNPVGYSMLRTANTGSTSITGFEVDIDGKRLAIYIDDANTTLVHNSAAGSEVKLILAKGSNYAASSGDVIEFMNDGNEAWREIKTTS